MPSSKKSNKSSPPPSLSPEKSTDKSSKSASPLHAKKSPSDATSDSDGDGGVSKAAATTTTTANPSDNDNPKQSEDLDCIGKLIGDYGKYQCVMTILLSLFQIPNTFHISATVFQAADKTFWCKRPPQYQNVSVPLWRNISDSNSNCFINKSFVNNSFYLPNVNDGGDLVACTEWEYNSTDHLGNTWQSEWDLVCNRSSINNVAQMFFLAGVALGGIVSGYLSDRFGRRKLLIVSVILQTIFAISLFKIKSFMVYMTIRTLLGFVSVSVTYAALILAIEFVDGQWCTIAGMYNLFPLPIAYMMIAGIAYLTQNYSWLQLYISLPGFVLCLIVFLIPESPRWLLVKGRIDEVKIIIKAACKFNGRQLPDNLDDYLVIPKEEASPAGGYIVLCKSKYLIRITICFFVIWFVTNMVYYGVILNLTSFGGNIYVISALAGAVEIPAIGVSVFTIMKLGKKWIFMGTYFLTGIACILIALVDVYVNIQWVKILFLLVGKFSIAGANTIMPVYTAELYPTAIRNAGVGCCNVAAGIGLVVVPYLMLMATNEAYLLMSILTAFSIIGGFITIALPSRMKSDPIDELSPDEIDLP